MRSKVQSLSSKINFIGTRKLNQPPLYEPSLFTLTFQHRCYILGWLVKNPAFALLRLDTPGENMSEKSSNEIQEESEEESEKEDNTRKRRANRAPPKPHEEDRLCFEQMRSLRFVAPIFFEEVAWPSLRKKDLSKLNNARKNRARHFNESGIFRNKFICEHRSVSFFTPLATQIEFTPPMEIKNIRWNEASARRGWMRSTACAAYQQAGWQVWIAGTNTPIDEQQKMKSAANVTCGAFDKEIFYETFCQAADVKTSAEAREVFSKYPFDIAFRYSVTHRKMIATILVVDDKTRTTEDLLRYLPLDEKWQSDEKKHMIKGNYIRYFPANPLTVVDDNGNPKGWCDTRSAVFFKAIRGSQFEAPIDGPSINRPKVRAWKG